MTYRTKAEIEADVAKIPKETKQNVLDLLRSGKTVGEIQKELNLDLMDTAEIICQNINTVSLLRNEAI